MDHRSHPAVGGGDIGSASATWRCGARALGSALVGRRACVVARSRQDDRRRLFDRLPRYAAACAISRPHCHPDPHAWGVRSRIRHAIRLALCRSRAPVSDFESDIGGAGLGHGNCARDSARPHRAAVAGRGRNFTPLKTFQFVGSGLPAPGGSRGLLLAPASSNIGATMHSHGGGAMHSHLPPGASGEKSLGGAC